ncbi:Hypothetical predicted protein, partial [Pelobates cultripes]
MSRHLNADLLTSDTDYPSGVTFCSQVKEWAKDKLADQAAGITDVIQEKGES